MLRSRMLPLLSSLIILTGCIAAENESSNNKAAEAAGCRLPPVIYDSPDNPYPSRFVLPKEAFDDAKKGRREETVPRRLPLREHLLGQRDAEIDAAACWLAAVGSARP